MEAKWAFKRCDHSLSRLSAAIGVLYNWCESVVGNFSWASGCNSEILSSLALLLICELMLSIVV